MDPQGSSPSCGVLGVKNKPKIEVKIQNFPHKMSAKPKILRLRRATLVKQDQLIFIYSKMGAKSMHLGE